MGVRLGGGAGYYTPAQQRRRERHHLTLPMFDMEMDQRGEDEDFDPRGEAEAAHMRRLLTDSRR